MDINSDRDVGIVAYCVITVIISDVN